MLQLKFVGLFVVNILPDIKKDSVEELTYSDKWN